MGGKLYHDTATSGTDYPDLSNLDKSLFDVLVNTLQYHGTIDFVQNFIKEDPHLQLNGLIARDLFVETQAGGLVMAARGSATRRPDRRMRSWWRHEQTSVRMALITASHHNYRKTAGIEIGMQPGAPCFTILTWNRTTLTPMTSMCLLQ